MRRIAVTLCLAALALGACQSERAQMAQPLPQAPAYAPGVEGRWASVEGPFEYLAVFENGRFTSAERKTNGLLAEGNYTNTGASQIQLNFTSIERGVQIAANCNHGGGQMVCTSSDGSTFRLARA